MEAREPPVPARGGHAAVVLASASPRRAAMLRDLGVSFEVVVSDVDERLLPGEDGAVAAERLARAKAERVAAGTNRPVIAADTVVLCDGDTLGKPGSREGARAMLARLSGRRHEVVTGVCVAASGRLLSGIERTSVVFAPLGAADIDWYVATGEPLDKAGAYHLGGRGALFVEAVHGSPSNVAGLPIRLLARIARAAGLELGPPRT